MQEIVIYPIKSLGGLSLTRGRLTLGGLAGDRRWSVQGADGRALRARDVPQLAQISVIAVDQEPVLSLGGGVSGKAADQALSELLNRPVQIVEATRIEQPDFAEPIHLAADSGQQRGSALVRANIFLRQGSETVGDLPTHWVGRQAALGAGQLRFTRRPRSCPGIYAEVRALGEFSLGQRLQLFRSSGEPA